MSTPWFFLSYASISPEYDKEVQGFSSDLVKAIRAEAQLTEKSISNADIGFCAPTVMDEGVDWPKELAEKLASCRVFVCLFSKRYFESAACGKEFRIFSDRLHDYAAQTDATSVSFIVPVLWVAKKGFADSLPRAARNLHYANPYLETVFECGGVYHLKMLSEEKGTYQKYVQHAASRIIKAAEAKSPLPALEKIPSFDDSSNAWIEPPAAPIGLDAVSSAPRQIRLTWENNSTNELGFTVQRQREDGRTEFIPIKQLNAGSTSYTDSRVTGGTTYRYRVCAFNDGGSSDYSETVEIKTDGQPPPPMPSDLSGSAVSKHQIDLRWKDNSSGNCSFKVERCDAFSEASFKQVADVGSGVNSFSNVGLTTATRYIYRVCALDDNGDSDYSDEVTVTTLNAWPITIPILISILVLIIAAGSGLVFRCNFFPSLCASPPPVLSTTFADPFNRKPNRSEGGWIRDAEWSYPVQAWTMDKGLDGTEEDGALVVQGTTPGFTKKSFDNFEARFTISFLKGNRAGWFLRSNAESSNPAGYRFVLEKGINASAGLYLHVEAVGSPESNVSPRISPIAIYEYGQPNDYIAVKVRVTENRITYEFTLMNPNGADKRPVVQAQSTVGCDDFKDEGSTYIKAGHLGFFADSETVFKVEELFVTAPPPPRENGV